jgi:hypothetical protein
LLKPAHARTVGGVADLGRALRGGECKKRRIPAGSATPPYRRDLPRALWPEVVDFNQANANAVVQSREQHGVKARRQRRGYARLGTESKHLQDSGDFLLAMRVRDILSRGQFWGELNDWAPRAIGSGAQFVFPAFLPAHRREIWLADCLD